MFRVQLKRPSSRTQPPPLSRSALYRINLFSTSSKSSRATFTALSLSCALETSSLYASNLQCTTMPRLTSGSLCRSTSVTSRIGGSEISKVLTFRLSPTALPLNGESNLSTSAKEVVFRRCHSSNESSLPTAFTYLWVRAVTALICLTSESASSISR